MKKRKAQVTIFIIAGILIFTAVVFFFLFRQGVIPGIGEKPEENPGGFLEICIEDKLIEGVELISSQGGYIENSLNRTFKFSDEKDFTDISYLCYNQNYYLPCINQEPMLIQHLKAEVKEYVLDDVKKCFDNLVLSLDRRGYVVDATYNGFEIEFATKKIIIDINGKIILTKSGETAKQENLQIIIPSRFYDLAVVVQEIVSQEARFCNFEHLGFMLFYPKFNIEKFRTGDGIIIYTVQHKDTQEEFKFAVRSCVIPPGM
ncbi:hypothetical protein KAT80_03185 [Candidatus Pacearchaeota archaeon]|nr:hypothetical protein [Candidatus Pacearchaeota archaeon]